MEGPAPDMARLFGVAVCALRSTLLCRSIGGDMACGRVGK